MTATVAKVNPKNFTFEKAKDHADFWVRFLSKRLEEAGFSTSYDHGHFLSFKKEYKGGELFAFLSPNSESSGKELFLFIRGFGPSYDDLNVGHFDSDTLASLAVDSSVKLAERLEKLFNAAKE